jgi:hypothetical protein
MGVRGLTALLQRLAPRAVTTQDISHYRGKTLAVDASCYLNRFSESTLFFRELGHSLAVEQGSPTHVVKHLNSSFQPFDSMK